VSIKVYLVGGAVRDGFLGQDAEDRDYTVEAPSYEAMLEYIKSVGKVFLEKKEFFTVRALVDGDVDDYVLARKDGIYHDGRRPSEVSPGTIYDDLARRDFTMNAIALSGFTLKNCLYVDAPVFIDPHGGRADIENRLIRCVGAAEERFEEDALRMLRALRFSITKDMMLHQDIRKALGSRRLIDKLASVSFERKREELHKAFAHDTLRSLAVFGEEFPIIAEACFQDPLWLLPTCKERK